MADTRLLLIKHAAPQVVLGVSPEDWMLSPQGRERCQPLAHRVRPYAPAKIFTSEEAKAVETAKLLAESLGVPSEPAADLHEHDRRNVPQMRSFQFVSMMELVFRRPAELVLGKETADQALARFDAALAELLQKHPEQTIAVVTHGTVMALWLAKQSGRNGYALWRQMGLPSMAIISRPDLQLIDLVDKIE